MKLTLKLLGMLAVAVLATFGLTEAAGAQSYSGATLTLDDISVAPGEAITAVGDNFLPNADVSLVVASTPTEVGPSRSDGNGRFTNTFNAPTEVGAHTVTARDGVNTVVINFQVVAAGTAAGAPTASGALPYTGNNSSMPLAQIGAGLLAVGAIVAFSVRKRNQHLAQPKVDA